MKKTHAKYIVLFMALINIPFFPNGMNIFSCAFSFGVFLVMAITDYSDTKEKP